MSTSLAQSFDHVNRGLNKLLQQYRKPKFQALLTALLTQVQKLEDATWEVLLQRYLDNSVGGIQLDTLGRLVGRGRNNLNDANYLLAIKAQIRINRSCGTTKDICDVAVLSAPLGTSMAYGEGTIATIVFSILSSVSFDINTFFANLIATKSGGVRLLLEFEDTALTDSFLWSDDLTDVTDSHHGWGDPSNVNIGGFFASVFEG